MALTWDLSSIKNSQRVCWDKVSKEQLAKEEEDKKNGEYRVELFGRGRYTENGDTFELKNMTNYLIWKLGMHIGIPEITDGNYRSVYNRINLDEAIFGNMMCYRTPTGRVKPYYISRKDIKKHIGLKTNGSVLTKAQFLRQATKNYEL